MTFVEADLAPLKKALLSGTQSVSIGDKTITFRSLNELKKLIQEIEQSIAAQAAEDAGEDVPASPNRIQASFSKK